MFFLNKRLHLKKTHELSYRSNTLNFTKSLFLKYSDPYNILQDLLDIYVFLSEAHWLSTETAQEMALLQVA